MPLARRSDTDVLDTLNRLRATRRGYSLDQVYNSEPNEHMPYLIKAPAHVAPTYLFSLDLINILYDYEDHIIDFQMEATAQDDVVSQLKMERIRNSEVWRIIRTLETCAVESEPAMMSKLFDWSRGNNYSDVPPTMAQIILNREMLAYEENKLLKRDLENMKRENDKLKQQLKEVTPDHLGKFLVN